MDTPATQPWHYVCDNAACPRRGQVRVVWPNRLTNGMLTRPEPYCECGVEAHMRKVAAPGSPATWSDYDIFESSEPLEPCS